ncbi:hypothetical protein [Thermococcus sp.]|uniref:hypothetical protein n=1 Tax=Thermococcus sp. TaxID=35749 RepID=UPI00261EA85E|nr:hypothetical protein [Thermococcus sp.]
MEVLLPVMNLLVVGVVTLLWLVWKKARYRTPEIKKALLGLSLGITGLVGIFDVACYLHSKFLGWIPIIFFLGMLFPFAKDANKVSLRVLTLESKKSCEKITPRTILSPKSYPCLTELRPQDIC